MNANEITPKEKQEVKSGEQTRPGRHFVPDVDIFEDEDGLRLRADMPGTAQDKVRVELHDDVLTLEGEVSLDAYEGLDPLYSEYNVGNYQRRFSIPPGAFDEEKIEARLVDGVLEVRLPKAEKAKPRRIPIAVG